MSRNSTFHVNSKKYTMFENLITRITSPNSRRRHTYNCQQEAALMGSAEPYSEPEIDDNDEETNNGNGALEVHPEKSDFINNRRARPNSRHVIERRRVRGRKVPEPGLRQARSLGRLDGLREAERLAEYSKTLSGSQPALLDPRSRDLDRIQNQFPQDFLGLHEADPTDLTRCGGFRQRTKSGSSLSSSVTPRYFLMDTPCAMGPPGNIQAARQRHLFLFSDILIIAKARNAVSYKLKETIRLSEIWLASSPDHDTSFLLGWPGQSTPRTYLMIWATHAAKDAWWSALQKTLSKRLPQEPKFTSVRVIWKDPTTEKDLAKTLSIRPETTSSELARLALPRTLGELNAYTLYCRTRQDSIPTALKGYERPHAIQLARLKQDVSADEGFDLAHCISSPNASSVVLFELRPNTKPPPKKTPLKLFRKNTTSRVWGVPLSRLCPNGTLPPVLVTILRSLMQRGPHTHGIFRKCASVRSVREYRDKIDRIGTAACEELSCCPPLLLAALLKDFLRSLPEPLITGDASMWVKSITNTDKLRSLVANLPRENNSLLANIICVLYHIAKRAEHNQMHAKNLGVCVGPSILWDVTPVKESAILVETLVAQCRQIFGPHIVSLLGEPAPDSGAEESDSLHSLVDSVELSRDQKSLSRDSGLTLSEDDRDSPGLAWAHAAYHHLPHSNTNLLSPLSNQRISPLTTALAAIPQGSRETLDVCHQLTTRSSSISPGIPSPIGILNSLNSTPRNNSTISLTSAQNLSNLSLSPPTTGFQRGGRWRQAARSGDLPHRPPAPAYRLPPPVFHKSRECIVIDESESYV